MQEKLEKNIVHSATNIGCKLEDFQKNFLSYFTPTLAKKISEKKKYFLPKIKDQVLGTYNHFTEYA